MNHVPSLAIALTALAAIGCSAGSTFARFPAGNAVLLLDGPVHLGDNRANDQNFPTGQAEAARICTLVNLPQPAIAHLQVQNVRQTESLADVVTVNGKPSALPITLERDHLGLTPNATSASPIEVVSLPAGPSEICLVSGRRLCGDLDDFEVDQMVLFVQGIDANEIGIRRNITLGRPPPGFPPSVPWGRDQAPQLGMWLPRWCPE
jgi:hypothetical protein